MLALCPDTNGQRSFQRGVYPAEDFTAVKKYGLNMLVSSDDQVRAYIKKIMSQLDKWMVGGKISKLVIVITDKDTGEHVERWQFDVWFPSGFPILTFFFFFGTDLLRNTPNPLGPNLRQTKDQVEIQNQPLRNRRPKPGELVYPAIGSGGGSRKGGQDRGRDPSRDRRHLPSNHRLRHLPPPALRRLHLQRARLRRRVERGARRVGR